ncbi:hypothetical protein GCM10010191_76390 [Actinomadura vinacea]|uniref:Uncharacterized protein n=1 Tax=Actinomadura vinacea TaxID=115336 RepID=A0ABN3K2S7_9ACTN
MRNHSSNLRNVSLGMIGPIAEGALRGITADAVFLGVDADRRFRGAAGGAGGVPGAPRDHGGRRPFLTRLAEGGPLPGRGRGR